MMRSLFALTLVSFSCAVAAGPPLPVDVRVTNRVLPVEVANADPIPVTLSDTAPIAVQNLRTYYRWYNSISNASDVVFQVPTGKRVILTDFSVGVQTDEVSVPPTVGFYQECEGIDGSSVRVGFWSVVPIQGNKYFQLTEHLTGGIPFSAGECLRVTLIPSGSAALLWYVEDAT
jgi:hypothetical protein